MPTIEQLRKAPHRFVDCPDCGKIRPRDSKRAKRIKDGAEPATPMLCIPCKRKPENWEHGTAMSYVQYKCRCRICKDWKRDGSRKYVPPSDTDLTGRHGTSTAYTAYKCRCDECREWKSANDAKFADRVEATCEEPTCAREFRTRRKTTRFCSFSCVATFAQRELRIARTTPVLYDSAFAQIQQQRVQDGKFKIGRRPGHWVTDKEREEIYRVFNRVCQDCLITCDHSSVGTQPSLDHVLPWSSFYEYDPLRDHRSNLIVLCRSCNTKRQTKFTPRVWISLMVRTGDITPEYAQALRESLAITTPKEEINV